MASQKSLASGLRWSFQRPRVDLFPVFFSFERDKERLYRYYLLHATSSLFLLFWHQKLRFFKFQARLLHLQQLRPPADAHRSLHICILSRSPRPQVVEFLTITSWSTEPHTTSGTFRLVPMAWQVALWQQVYLCFGMINVMGSFSTNGS